MRYISEEKLKTLSREQMMDVIRLYEKRIDQLKGNVVEATGNNPRVRKSLFRRFTEGE